MLLYVIILELIYKFVEISLTCQCLSPRFNNKVSSFLIIYIPTSIIQIYSAYHNFDSVPLSLLMFAVYITLSCLLFKDKPSRKAIVTLFISLICALISEIYFSISKLRGITNYFVDDRIGTATCLLIMCIVEAVFAIIWKKKANSITISGRDLSLFMVLPVSQAIIAVAYQAIEKSNFWSIHNMNDLAVDSQMIFFIVYMVLCIVADFIIFSLLIRISNVTREEDERKFAILKSELNIDHYHTLEQNSEQIHKLKHDIANCVSVVCALVENDNQNSEENKVIAKQLVEEMNLAVNSIPNDTYSNNKIVNIILCQLAKQCDEKNIKYDFHSEIPVETGIEEIDICRVMTNMADNAIKAAEKCSEGWISIDLKIIDDYLYIKILNSYDPNSPEERDAGNHGYGQKILKDIALEYDGMFIGEAKGDKYSALTTMRVNI